MAFLGYFTQFRTTGSLLFPVIFSIELEYFELKLNELNDFC